MIKEIKKAAARVLLAVQRHNQPALTEFRLSQCNSCDTLEPENRVCQECGCFVDIKAEYSSNRDPELLGQTVITHCPLGKWGDKPIAELYREIKNKPPLGD